MPGSAKAVILIVEDDTAIRRGLVDSLAFAGYTPRECSNGTNALVEAMDPAVDLLLLDVVLPGRNGFEILQELRRSRPTLAVIMITARGAEEDRVRGLRDGADDYMVKPFSARELLARVEAVLRRAPEREWGVLSLSNGDCRIDFDSREVARGNCTTVNLTEREISILRYLAVNRDKAVDRQDLLHRVWGVNPRGMETRAVDMHIARLREKVESDPSHPQFILTIRGKGYRLANSVVVETR